MSPEAIIGLVLTALTLMGGFLLWLTNISSGVGFIKGQLLLRVETLEKQTDKVEKRVNHHSDQIDGLSVKVAKLEGA